MATIGILGGGQLARMLAIAGAPLGHRFLVVDSAPDACASHVAPLLKADWRDFDALEKFASQIDVATFDFENVPSETAEWLTSHTRVFPNPAALSVAQDRLLEKNLFGEIGLETPVFAAVDSIDDLRAAVAKTGLPAVLKTRRLGYDGKGQAILKQHSDIESAWEALGSVPLILEAFVPFDSEMSVIAVRSRSGEFRHYPLTRNWHRDGILSASFAPIKVDEDIERRAVARARALAERLDYVGVFALELFFCEGRLLGNEMAPRVHNSGHWTIEGTACSQFENHVRAVIGLPLGDTEALGPAAMLNWVGELPDATPILAEARAHWHDYGKSPREGRKVGHATICADSNEELIQRLQRIGRALDREDHVAPVIAALAASNEATARGM
ncbi:5-(carboxyamino)imidazole ribonucleotide synthase [Dokdonella sp.]|uniref:5-(carboxyamino)imidazole ribonucleotide synthase n=1 Tax=Dokdonella sp. TaxID=2291710 RepID=UPI00352841EA